jgi:Flp pilus assembly protein TadD
MKTTTQCLALGFAFISSLTIGFAAPSKPSEPKADPSVVAYNEGTEYLMELEFAKAESNLREALRENPKMAEAHNNLAYALRKQGEAHYDDALKHYNRAIEINPKMAEAYMYRGVLYVQMGEPEKALADHRTLLQLSPSLAAELEYVVKNGREKTPEQFFGVAKKKKS